MAYSAWSVVFGEQPSAAKWNILGENDASFNDGTGIADGAITSEKLTGTIAFRAYRNSAHNLSSSTTIVPFDTEDYDVGSDFNTGTYTFTAPIAGIYHFFGRIDTSSTTLVVLLYLNGSEEARGTDVRPSGSITVGCEVSADIKLSQNDTVDFRAVSSGTTLMSTARNRSYFGGHFVGAA